MAAHGHHAEMLGGKLHLSVHRIELPAHTLCLLLYSVQHRTIQRWANRTPDREHCSSLDYSRMMMGAHAGSSAPTGPPALADGRRAARLARLPHRLPAAHGAARSRAPARGGD